MYAAGIYNEKENNEISCIYGAVTTGDEWKFIQLVKGFVYIDIESYYINDIKKIIGILVKMAN